MEEVRWIESRISSILFGGLEGGILLTMFFFLPFFPVSFESV